MIVTHDSVRPFVTHRILEDNIRYAKEMGACDTVIPATDTIVESADNKQITSIPNRSKMYQGQTPQSFRAKKAAGCLYGADGGGKGNSYGRLQDPGPEGRAGVPGRGEVFNIKITYPHDLRVAESLLGGN